MMSESIGELAAALVKAQAKLPKIHKGETANVGKFAYSYADLTDIKDKCDPVINAEGLVVTQWPSVHEQGPSLTTILLHESGQFISNEMLLLATDRTSQGQGSGITYAKRYSYCAALGIAPDKDDDGAAASQPSFESAAPSAGPVDSADVGELVKRKGRLGAVQREALMAWAEEHLMPLHPKDMSGEERDVYLAKIVELEAS